MIFKRRARLCSAENTQWLRTPGGEPRRHSVTHEEIQPFARGRNRLIHRCKSRRFGHFYAGDKVGNHVAGAKAVSGVQNAPDPLVTADVTVFPAAVDFEAPPVPS